MASEARAPSLSPPKPLSKKTAYSTGHYPDRSRNDERATSLGVRSRP